MPQEKQIINLKVDTKDIMSDLEKDFENLPDMTSNRELKQLIKDTIKCTFSLGAHIAKISRQ